MYKWNTDKQKQNLIKKIRELLIEFLDNPLKPDNPPQDFLQHKPTLVSAPAEEIKDILEYDSKNKPLIVLPKKHLSKKLAVGLILLGNAGNKLTMSELVNQVSKNWKKVKSTDLSPLLSHSGGWFYSEGTRGNYVYSLSNKGRKELLNTVSLLKKK